MFLAIWMLCGNCVGGEVRGMQGLGAGRVPLLPPSSSPAWRGPEFLPEMLCRVESVAQTVSVDISCSGKYQQETSEQRERLPGLGASGLKASNVLCYIINRIMYWRPFVVYFII